eukprot:m.333481 g.333481  ORF g.333481 m.333481 type:complete len:139 (+) comp17152_c0_seq1:44-460(+)
MLRSAVCLSRAVMPLARRTVAQPGIRHMAVTKVVDERFVGDYPNIPEESSQRRDPFVFQDLQDRRNFGEPVQENDELLSMWTFDENVAGDRVTKEQALQQLLMALGGLGLVLFVASKLKKESPVNKKSFEDQEVYFKL